MILEKLIAETMRAHEADAILMATDRCDWRARLNAARRYYAEFMDDIMACRNGFAIDPYTITETLGQTPIEHNVWMCIRDRGALLYPQFPVLGYVADFANPHSNVVIECDGLAFHNEERDRKRDAAMRAAGWSVYRLTGRECFNDEAANEVLERAGLAPARAFTGREEQ